MDDLLNIINERFKDCIFEPPLNKYTIEDKIIKKLNNYKNYKVSRGGKLIITFKDLKDYVVKVDLFSRVSDINWNQYYFYKTKIKNTCFNILFADMKALKIGEYYLYIQEKITILKNEDDYLNNENLSKYDLNNIDIKKWEDFLDKYSFHIHKPLCYWCHTASALYNEYMVKCLLILLKINNTTDLNEFNIGFDKDWNPKIIDF